MAVVERFRPARPQASGSTLGAVQPAPFQFYVSGEDSFRLRTWSSVVCTIALEGRWLREDGSIEVFRYTFLTDGTAVAQEFAMPVQGMYLLNCVLDVLAPYTAPGQCFAQLLLGRGAGNAFIKLGTVLQGYIGTAKFLAFPGSPLEDSVSGPGFRSLQGITPVAAGTEWSVRPPTHRLWRVAYVFATLTCAIGGADRAVCTFLRPGLGPAQAFLPPVYNQPAGSGSNYTWAPGLTGTSSNAALACSIPLPDPIYLEDFMDMKTFTFNIAAGDTWTAMVIHFEEWLVTDTVPAFTL